MSSRRKTSIFIPPAVSSSQSKTDLPSTVLRKEYYSLTPTESKRRFSHDEKLPPVPPETTAADLDVISTLCQGSFAELVLVRRRDTNQIMVAKAFNVESWRSEYLFSAELRVLNSVNSPWLIDYYGHIQDFEEDFLLLAYMDLGNFYQLMVKLKRPLANEAKFYGAEMFMAVHALHQEGFMHRNIQLSNFLLHSSGHLRLCDFGLSYKYEKPTPSAKKGSRPKLSLVTSPVYASAENSIPVTQTLSSSGAIPLTASGPHQHQTEITTSYLSPEVLRLLMPKPFFNLLHPKIGYSFLCDYWSLGVCLYHMMYGYLPFLPDSKGTIFDKVLDYRKTLTFPMNPAVQVSVLGISIIRALLLKEEARLGRNEGIAEVQAHPFFCDIQWNFLGHGKVSVPIKDSEIARYIGQSSTDSSEPWVSSNKETRDTSDETEEEAACRQALTAHRMDFEIPMISDPTVPCTHKSTCPGGVDYMMGRFHVKDPSSASLVDNVVVVPVRASSYSKDTKDSGDRPIAPQRSLSDGQAAEVKPSPIKSLFGVSPGNKKATEKKKKEKVRFRRDSSGVEIAEICEVLEEKNADMNKKASSSSLERRNSDCCLFLNMIEAENSYLSKLTTWFQNFQTEKLQTNEKY